MSALAYTAALLLIAVTIILIGVAPLYAKYYLENPLEVEDRDEK